MPANTIAGVVFEPAFGRVLAGVQVAVDGHRAGKISDKAGRFQFVVPGPGKYQLVVQLIGYHSMKSEIELEPGRGVVAQIGLQQVAVPVCGLIVCAGPGGCSAVWTEVRDALTGKAPQAPVKLIVRDSIAADSMSVERHSTADVVNLSAGGRLFAGALSVDVTGPGYAPWRQTGVRRSSCSVLNPRPFYVWLLPT